MHDLVGAIVEGVTKVDGVVSAWQITIDRCLAWGLGLAEVHRRENTWTL